MKNELLAKYIFDEANTKERQVVERWLNECEDHQREYQQIKRRLELGSKRYKPGVFNTRQAVLGMKFPSKRHSLQIVRVAAAVVALTLGIWYWNHVQFRETVLVSNAGETKVFYLPDSSQVTLTGECRLIYNSRFGQSNRELYLQGEAFFKVKHDSEKPFVVKTSLIQVEVLGTFFQVVSREQRAEVSVKKGRVRVTTMDEKQKETLETGMSARYEKVKGELMIFTNDGTGLLDGQSGVLRFNNTPLPKVIETLNKYYGSHIVLPDEYASLRITVVFKAISLEKAIEIINKTLDIQLTI